MIKNMKVKSIQQHNKENRKISLDLGDGYLQKVKNL